jgi:hypothetical protein
MELNVLTITADVLADRAATAPSGTKPVKVTVTLMVGMDECQEEVTLSPSTQSEELVAL